MTTLVKGLLLNPNNYADTVRPSVYEAFQSFLLPISATLIANAWPPSCLAAVWRDRGAGARQLLLIPRIYLCPAIIIVLAAVVAKDGPFLVCRLVVRRIRHVMTVAFFE